MENTKSSLNVWDTVFISYLSPLAVKNAKFIPPIHSTTYTISYIWENSIKLQNEKYGIFTFYKWHIKLKKYAGKNENVLDQ